MIINAPNLWLKDWPVLKTDGHKYDRGHALILGGPIQTTGAARLAARAALRTGAGLVSVACDRLSLPIYAGAFEAVMTKVCDDAAAFEALMLDARISAVLLGPAAGVNDATKTKVLSTLRHPKPAVIDADGLSVFADDPQILFNAIKASAVLTPHEGEFARLFGPIADRETAVQKAALRSNAVIVLKGRYTLIAAPDGRLVINQNAPPTLATAGSGDVLAGIITGLLAQSMPAFEAACAGVWLHAEAANRFGLGLIAEDLNEQIPPILSALRSGTPNPSP
jgi:NAD(P)H-hydrate epimerase